MSPCRQIGALLAGLIVVSTAPAAQAGGSEHQLNVMAHWSGGDAHGAGGGLGYSWGVDDWWNLTVEVDWATLLPPEGSVRQLGNISAGTTYNIDFFEWVPYLRLTVGGFLGLSDGESVGAFAISVGGGVDYRPARRWAIGLWGVFHGVVVGDLEHTGAAGLRASFYFR